MPARIPFQMRETVWFVLESACSDTFEMSELVVPSFAVFEVEVGVAAEVRVADT